MKAVSVALGFALLVLGGCGGEVDHEPAVFGITPELRAEMRGLVAETDPAADPDEVVKDYMERLKKRAVDKNIAPNATGDYELPAEEKKAMDEMVAKAKSDPNDGSAKAIIDEFALELPEWTAPLVAEEEAGTITPKRRELLVKVLYLELSDALSR